MTPDLVPLVCRDCGEPFLGRVGWPPVCLRCFRAAQMSVVSASPEVIEHRILEHERSCELADWHSRWCPCGASVVFICDCGEPLLIVVDPARALCVHARELLLEPAGR
jgi:hypothetical protein